MFIHYISKSIKACQYPNNTEVIHRGITHPCNTFWIYYNGYNIIYFCVMGWGNRITKAITPVYKTFPKMEKKLKVLSHFDDKYKGVAFNEFLYFIRNGKLDAEKLISDIQKKLAETKSFYARYNYGELKGTNAQWEIYFKIIPYSQQLEEFYEALAEAEEWEKKSPEERGKIKAERAEYYKNLNMKNSMKGKPATENQIRFLKKKGLKDVPTDRYECSKIIDKLIGKK